jgi:hypothetical protein
MSTEAAILRGKGIISNPAFFMIFILSAAMGIGAVISLAASWLHYDIPSGATELQFLGVRLWAVGLIAVLAALFAVAYFSGLGEKLFVALIAFGGLVSGWIAGCVIVHVMGLATDATSMVLQLVYGTVATVVLAVAPAAVIAGERVLPVFVAFVAGIWGIISVIVLVMVIFGAAGPH